MTVNSSTSSFKRNSKKNKIRKSVKILVLIVIFLVILFAVNNVLTWLFRDDEGHYARLTIHEMYTQEENIDVLFLGSSHCFRSLDPEVTDDIFDANTFNLGTPAQPLDGSYTLLVEAGKTNEIKQVYVEMYYFVVSKSIEERELASVYNVSDYLKPSLNKFNYLLNAADSDYYINSFFTVRRFFTKMFDTDSTYVLDNIRYKMSDAYRLYENYEDDEIAYEGKGYAASKVTIQNENFSRKKPQKSIADDIFADSSIAKESIENMAEYCSKNGIELVLYSAPMEDFRLYNVGNYDSYIEQVEDVCAEYNIKYYDFNLCKEEYFSYESDYFSEKSHLSRIGAEVFSELFAEFFTGQIDEEDLFYDSYNEKLEESSPKMYGIIYKIKEVKGQKKIRITPVTNDEEGTYYYVISKKTEESDEYVEFLSFTDPEPFFVDKEESGTMKVEIYSDPELQNRTNEITFSY